MSNMLAELGYAGFEVSDLKAWDRFCRDVLGADVTAGAGTARTVRIDDQAYRLLLVEGPLDDVAFAGWKAHSTEALDAFIAHLDASGVAWREGSSAEIALRGVERLVSFSDPDGNRHEVSIGSPAVDGPFSSPLVSSGFVTGEGGLGHLVLACFDYPAMIRFAQDILGMKLSDTITQKLGETDVEVSFFHLNERHHSLAFSSRPGRKRLHHFLLEVGSIEDVGLGWERHRASEFSVVQDIGQHPNDRMVSYYGATPSGFLIEFGWGGVKIDDTVWETTSYPRFSDWGHHFVQIR